MCYTVLPYSSSSRMVVSLNQKLENFDYLNSIRITALLHQMKNVTSRPDDANKLPNESTHRNKISNSILCGNIRYIQVLAHQESALIICLTETHLNNEVFNAIIQILNGYGIVQKHQPPTTNHRPPTIYLENNQPPVVKAPTND